MTVGFIGTGNMGGALARAAAKAIPAKDIYLYDRFAEKAEALAVQLGCCATDLSGVAKCNYIFLGVKPQMMQEMFSELAPILKNRNDEFVLVSMAAGLEMVSIQVMAGEKYPVIRIMPNMPVSVGAGMIEYDATENVSESQLEGFLQCMQFAGQLDHLQESLIDAGTSVAGCGPAFAFLFIEALTEGGVACGLTKQQAELYAKQMLFGSAKLALESDMQPSELREAVCSPGGSTIEGIKTLWQKEFSQIVSDAVMASFRRNQELGKK